jgi:hypothetical protein
MALIFTECGCTATNNVCQLHNVKSGTIRTNSVCGHAEPICDACKARCIAKVTHHLNSSGSSIDIQHLYYFVTQCPWWPPFVRSNATLYDVDTVGDPTPVLHPFIDFIWRTIAPLIAEADDIHIQGKNVWAVGPWIEHAFVRLPLNEYKQDVIRILPATKILSITPEKAALIFNIYITEYNSAVAKRPFNTIRKKTQFNIASVADLKRELEHAEWSGIPITELCKESQHMPLYINTLTTQKMAILIGGKLYSASRIKHIKKYITPYIHMHT